MSAWPGAADDEVGWLECVGRRCCCCAPACDGPPRAAALPRSWRIPVIHANRRLRRRRSQRPGRRSRLPGFCFLALCIAFSDGFPPVDRMGTTTMNPRGRTGPRTDGCRRGRGGAAFLRRTWPARRGAGVGRGAVRAAHHAGHRIRRRRLRRCIDLIARHRPADRSVHARHRAALPRDLSPVADAREHYGLRSRAVQPEQTVEGRRRRWGAALWERDPDRCRARRKVDAADGHARPASTRGSPPSGASRRTTRAGRGRSSGTISSTLVKVEPADPLDQAEVLELHPRVRACRTILCTTTAIPASAARPARARSGTARTSARDAGAASTRRSASFTGDAVTGVGERRQCLDNPAAARSSGSPACPARARAPSRRR